MPPCSFCGAKGNKAAPICQSCGSIRYPIANKKPSSPHTTKIITSAAVAAAILTPGSLILLAMVGASRLSSKPKK